jgi:hypothetical protein
MFCRCGFGCNEGNAEQGVVGLTWRIGMREVFGLELGHDTVNIT